jgi:hypothetical protein
MMTLDSLGNIGEFVSGVAVIVSLIYLATQVRQHSHATRSAALSSISASVSEFLDHVARDPELTALWFDGLSGQVELSETEQRRFSLLLLSLARRWESAFYQSTSADLESDAWAGVQGGLVFIFSAPGAQAWWNGIGQMVLSKDFIAFAERSRLAVPQEPPASSPQAS